MPTGISIDEFRARVEDTKVKCRLCGFKAFALSSHLKEVHNLSVGQYKNQFKDDASVASPVVVALMRRMDRSPKPSNDLEAYLPSFEGAAGKGGALVESLKGKVPDVDIRDDTLVPPRIEHFFFDEDATRKIMAGLVLGQHVAIVGPTGCGKTELVKQIHHILNRPLARVNMNGDVTAGNFYGETQASPSKGTWFQEGFLPIAMKSGHSLLLDEMDYCPPHISALLNPVLDDSSTLDIKETAEYVKAASGFRVFATMNTAGKGDETGVYSGTEIMNTALLDRFGVVIRLGYPPETEEKAFLATMFPSASQEEIDKLVKFANEVRGSFLKGSISVTMSTRKLTRYLSQRAFLDQKEALSACLLDWLNDVDRTALLSIAQNVALVK